MKTAAIELHPNVVVEAVAPPSAKARVAAYIELTKPRITFLIVLTSAAGFCLGTAAPQVLEAILEFWIVGHRVLPSRLSHRLERVRH